MDFTRTSKKLFKSLVCCGISDSFTYSNNTITVPEPLDADVSPGPRIGHATTIKFAVNTDVNRVFYNVNEVNEINATKSEQEDYYLSTPKKIGWPDNKNVTLNVSAEIIYYFENHVVDGKFVEFNNTIVDTDTYYFSVVDDPNVGTEPSADIALPGPRYVLAPGFEALMFLISLIVVVLIFKYRKKDSRNQK